LGDSLADWPRTWLRRKRKALGLPASHDVGALGKLVKALRDMVESRLDIRVETAVLSFPHLVALYQDDSEDIYDYVGIRQMMLWHNIGYFHPVVWETAVLFAGHGHGICPDYQNWTACRSYFRNISDHDIFAVHYSRNALTTSLAGLATATALWEPDYRRTEDFSLGYSARFGYSSEAAYWDIVSDNLSKIMVSDPRFQKPTMIFLTGDMVENATFQRVLATAMANLMDPQPEIVMGDHIFAPARGAMEFAKRAEWNRLHPPPLGNGSEAVNTKS